MTVNRLLVVAAVVVFIIVAVLAFLTNTTVETLIGLLGVGGACYAGAAVA